MLYICRLLTLLYSLSGTLHVLLNEDWMISSSHTQHKSQLTSREDCRTRWWPNHQVTVGGGRAPVTTHNTRYSRPAVRGHGSGGWMWTLRGGTAGRKKGLRLRTVDVNGGSIHNPVGKISFLARPGSVFRNGLFFRHVFFPRPQRWLAEFTRMFLQLVM